MPALRATLNRGNHGLHKNKRRAPFRKDIIARNALGPRVATQYDYPKAENIHISPTFCNLVLMAFESALSNGGWRPDEFTEWFTKNILELPVELIQTIEGRLYPVIIKSSGRKMSDEDYRIWYSFASELRRYLYDI